MVEAWFVVLTDKYICAAMIVLMSATRRYEQDHGADSKKDGWTQLEAAKRCSVTQPRINGLLRGRISRFSLDALVNIAPHLGQRVLVKLEAA